MTVKLELYLLDEQDAQLRQLTRPAVTSHHLPRENELVEFARREDGDPPQDTAGEFTRGGIVDRVAWSHDLSSDRSAARLADLA
ncbi:hypothetical protein [Humibacter sp.]|uniref:hypothetical protein n=1 Tax=Humibacter sp. TaxID=1940291 RepID=UPI002B8B699C|nr:hypothetical protein [Humibacter sp.]HVX07612.1 hypothetical protein [Humibacter sp.]